MAELCCEASCTMGRRIEWHLDIARLAATAAAAAQRQQRWDTIPLSPSPPLLRSHFYFSFRQQEIYSRTHLHRIIDFTRWYSRLPELLKGNMCVGFYRQSLPHPVRSRRSPQTCRLSARLSICMQGDRERTGLGK